MIKVSRPLATSRRQRGVIHGSISGIKRVTEFKTLPEARDLSDVKHLTIQQKLEKSHASFKEFHFGVWT